MEYFDLFSAPPPIEQDKSGPFAKLFQGAPQLPEDGGKPAEGLFSRLSEAAQSYLKWNMIGSPGATPGEMMKGVADWASLPMREPVHVPADSHTDDSGRILVKRDGQLVPWQDADPVASRAYEEDMRARSQWGPQAALSMMGATPFRLAPTGSLGMFAGPKAATADHGALDLAEQMAKNGFDRRQIWDASGWFQGADKKWRFEIPDDQAAFRGNASKLGESLDHAALYAAYPEMRDIKMLYGKPPNSASYYPAQDNMPQRIAIPGYDRHSQRSLTLHEGQHDIQTSEGFARGGSSSVGARMKGAAGIENRLAEIEKYRNLAGEVEARNVQNRSTMTPEQRRATPPWGTEDVPLEQQIVRGAN